MSDSMVPPDGERRHTGWYTQFEERFEKHVARLDKQINNNARDQRAEIKHFISKTLIGFTIVGICCAIAIGGFGIVLSNQSDAADQIQTQRYNTLVSACQQQNERHDSAINTALTDTSLKVVGRSSVIRLIDQLQPRNGNCEAYANRRVKGLP